MTPPNSARAATMNDVAERAGVALKTVSRYVNGATNIRADLVERIALAIDELDYRHNLAAASLRPGRSAKVIGLIIGDLANPFWAAVARSVERICTAHGYLLVTASTEEDTALHDRLVARLTAQGVDALITAPSGEAVGSELERAARRVPIVAIDRPSPLASCSITVDNRGGARAATELLLPHGRVAFLGDSTYLWTIAERLDGFRDVAPADSPILIGAHTAADAHAQVREVLHEGGIDAIFASNNRASAGALMAFAETGIRLPLIGFDDFEWATLVSPAVSVVAPDAALLGRAAADAALQLCAGQAVADQVLSTELVLRGSERAARAVA